MWSSLGTMLDLKGNIALLISLLLYPPHIEHAYNMVRKSVYFQSGQCGFFLCFLVEHDLKLLQIQILAVLLFCSTVLMVSLHMLK